MPLAGGTARRIHVRQRCPVDDLDGLIISGGDDVHPSLFDAEPDPERFYDPARDELEQDYIRQGRARGLPMLGICRGHQLINVVQGSTLQSIRAKRQNTYNRRGLLATKTARLQPDSLLAELAGRNPLRINSLHIQAVDEIAEPFRLAAQDLDDFCQALEWPDARIITVQWHPEYLTYLPAHRRLFAWLVGEAGRNRADVTAP